MVKVGPNGLASYANWASGPDLLSLDVGAPSSPVSLRDELLSV